VAAKTKDKILEIDKRFKELWNDETIRFSGCVQKLAYEFSLSQTTIEMILNRRGFYRRYQ
jgi:predicted transcriptional regulator